MESVCQICQLDVRTGNNQIVDGKTKRGPWAYMCTGCHREHGVGLGTGKGQKYDVRTGTKLEG